MWMQNHTTAWNSFPPGLMCTSTQNQMSLDGKTVWDREQLLWNPQWASSGTPGSCAEPPPSVGMTMREPSTLMSCLARKVLCPSDAGDNAIHAAFTGITKHLWLTADKDRKWNNSSSTCTSPLCIFKRVLQDLRRIGSTEIIKEIYRRKWKSLVT